MNWKTLSPYLIGIFSFGIILMFIPYLLTLPTITGLEFSDSGAIGDTIGGTTAPFIGFLGVFFTFLAFYIQYEANEQTRKDIKLERFENKFYEMVRLHRENVQEIKISGKHSGRKAFVKMYQEFNVIYKVCNAIINKYKIKNISINDQTKLAYTIFFFGVGEISNRGLNYYLGEFEEKIISSIIKELQKCQKKYSSKKNNEWQKFNLKIGKEKIKFEMDFFPFDGHVSKLGHYFRHIYQTIKLPVVDSGFKDKNKEVEYSKRYSYVKTLRVQLSNHEQAMIYYNSFFDAGKVWWSDGTIDLKQNINGTESNLSYFLDYGLIKNLPLNLIEGMGPDPVREFFFKLVEKGYKINSEDKHNNLQKRLADLFEWHIKSDRFSQLVEEKNKLDNK
ncbi:hypothetical protein IFO69_04975 [Echinicola sp. CAU 1574]|uniref:Phage abortive infection protein n=1 Tax=Echinicola arenosa TaxID=2774144 RepID=A0ABR9AH46_9BACT|nr:putative phage abortive infection protein [Echinicola arenosa]MBD8488093.1 hypothetical protein [Echinicola arenosa]